MAQNVAWILHGIPEDNVLPWAGDHGVAHWARVLENGLHLAGETGRSSKSFRYAPSSMPVGGSASPRTPSTDAAPLRACLGIP